MCTLGAERHLLRILLVPVRNRYDGSEQAPGASSRQARLELRFIIVRPVSCVLPLRFARQPKGNLEPPKNSGEPERSSFIGMYALCPATRESEVRWAFGLNYLYIIAVSEFDYLCTDLRCSNE